VRRFATLIVLAAVVGACTGTAVATPAPTSVPTIAPTAVPASAAPAASTPAASPSAAPSLSFKAGPWPPDWQKWICEARAQLLREDAKAGGAAGEDAATQAIADLHLAPNWDPGGTLRALIGKAGFILLDAAPRSGNAMNDVPPALKAVEAAYQDLKASTGFECPQG
jgi:hypothetical protein